MSSSAVRLSRYFRVFIALCGLAFPLASSFGQANPFESEIRAFEAEDARNWPAPNTIVFIGSSTINMWDDVAAVFPKYNVLNRGFGGSETDDAVYFVDRIATPYRPPLIVFYEGDNDIAAGKTVDMVFKDTTNFFARVQSKTPNTHILYVSVKPSPSRASFMPQVSALNAKVKAFTDADPKLHYVDVYNPMLNTSGQPRPELFLSDNLHMNATGYALWTSIIGPALDEVAAAYPIPIAKGQSGSILVDAGAAETPTGTGAPSSTAWNNITTTVGATSNGSANLVTTAGAASSVKLQMISRFNGANENGTAASTIFPQSATRDSLFGNTESFSGLANVRPSFKLTGLTIDQAYKFTFYASRTGAGDNRQTRYTLTGATTATVDLNAANNVDEVATSTGLEPDPDGSITVALAPGPLNNNMNHFTYLGVLKVESTTSGGLAFLFDFGASGSTTATQSGTPTISWNNLLPSIGTTDDGALLNLIATNGLATGIDLQMTSRFNAANMDGAQNATVFPITATQDSLFGNTETFGGFANMLPAFKLRNLNAAATYDLTFYASRMGPTDNRETRYTAMGSSMAFADLNASGNIGSVATITGLGPDANREILISISPSPNNSNANHFTYLGVMRVNWATGGSGPEILFTQAVPENGVLRAEIGGAVGMIYTLQASSDFINWQEAGRVELTSSVATIELPPSGSARYYRLLQ